MPPEGRSISPIKEKGLRRNVGRDITLYRWNQPRRMVKGVLREDERGFFVGNGRNHRVRDSYRIGMDTRADQFRYYDVDLAA
jgi:hypothetical protein